MKLFKTLLVFLFAVFVNRHAALASHLYGGELFYTHISGKLYKVSMVLYGDCAGTASVFSALYTNSPQVIVYNGTSTYRTMSLKVLPGAGAEVTPVCAGSIGSTTCNGGTVPGVRRFAYSDTITLSASSSWRLRFNGNLGSSSSAGRSASITNIYSSGSTLMALEATLNNSSAENSSPTYTTIPTPFFCINVAQEYNPGAVDSNLSDSLVYNLIDGLDAASGSGGYVSYRTGYSATSPLATASGTFSFSNSTGQLTFTPNLAQISLVVCKVSEYRSGVLVGTSMREMNFIVLSSCSNRSPYGKIDSVLGGTLINNTEVSICKNDSLLSFKINPVDSDGNNILVSTAGVPAGATLAVSGSGTATPHLSFSWNISAVSAGKYYFFVTYLDNGCPLSSKQTVAYTVNVVAKPDFSVTLVSSATCVKKAVFDVVPPVSGAPWNHKVFSGATMIHTLSSSGTSIRDSLAPGTYTLRLTNTLGCYQESSLVINPAVPVVFSSISFTKPKCVGTNDGVITVSGSLGATPYQYSIDGGTFGSSAALGGLSAGAHTISIRDANYCTRDTTVTLLNPDSLVVLSLLKTLPLCTGNADGVVKIVASGGSGPYTFSIDGGASGSSGSFPGLPAGTHFISITDANSCKKDTGFLLADPAPVSLILSVKRPTCNAVANGSISLLAGGGTGPYTYAYGSAGAFGTSNIFTPFAAGTYFFKTKDANGCIKVATAVLTDSIKIATAISVKDVSCFSGTDGEIKMSPFTGQAPFYFALGSGVFSTAPTFAALIAGTYLLHIKDALGCTLDTSASVAQPTPLALSVKLSGPLCNGQSNGSITAKASGGTGPYLFSIDAKPYTAGATFPGLSAGLHNISVKDALGCTKDTAVTLSEPQLISVKATLSFPLCFGEKTGSILLTASGGTPSYTYAVNGGPALTVPLFSGLAAGSYAVSVTDKNACTKDTSVVITQPGKLYFDRFVVSSPTCEDYADGAVTLIGTGGVKPYQYAFGNANYSFSDVFSKLKAGTYNVHVRDSNNCVADSAVQLKGYPVIKMDSLQATATRCFGAADGAFNFFASGGNAPLRYIMEGSKDSLYQASYKNLQSKSYQLIVVDAKNCFKLFTAFVPDAEKLVVTTAIVNNDCTGIDTNGRIDAIVSGGTLPYQYRWSIDYTSNSSLSGLNNGNYFLKVKDAHDCIDSIGSEITYDNCCTPSVPNAFTPNNDGRNDEFRVLYKGNIQLKEFVIYNRYGQQVFSTQDINRGWDGRFLGRDMELGVYYYYIRMICGNKSDREVSYKGDLTLIR